MSKLTKKQRLQIYNKYDGHCAYCGKPIEYKDMQVDHIKPLLRGWCGSLREEYAHKIGDDDMSNLNPSCRACNFRKGTSDVETFRKAIEHGLVCLERDFTYRLLKQYGLVEEHRVEVVFYFEKNDTSDNKQYDNN